LLNGVSYNTLVVPGDVCRQCFFTSRDWSMTTKKTSPRSAGILLHPTSLPGPYGIGDLGPSAYGWVDALIHAKQTWWQILPLGPTGYGDSPYQCFSALAGNPHLVSPQFLV